MKNIYVLLLAFFTGLATVKGQQASEYHFGVEYNVHVEDMTGATTLIGANAEDVITTLPSKFYFRFNNDDFSEVIISSNGYLAFKQVSSAGGDDDNLIAAAPQYPILMPYWDALSTAEDGGVKYKLTGVTGSRKLIVDWKTKHFTDKGTTAKHHFQVWLFEGSNNIQFVYGNGEVVTFIDSKIDEATIGIAGASNNFIAVDAVGNSSNTMTFDFNQEWPGAGKSYRFSPSAMQPITVGSVTSINASCNEANGSITLNNISGGDGNYKVTWTSTTGFTGSGTTISGLAAGTYTYTVTDGSLSTPVTNSITITQPSPITLSNTIISPVFTVEGQNAHTIYLGYGDQSVTLTAGFVSGGTGSYKYQWNNAQLLNADDVASVKASPTTTTNYTLTVSDVNGCTASKSIVVNVIDVRCDRDKIFVCNTSGNSKTQCVNKIKVADLLKKGATLGACPTNFLQSAKTTNDQFRGFNPSVAATTIKVFPNPSSGVFTVQLENDASLIMVTDINGRTVLQQKTNSFENNIQINLQGQAPGIYLLKILAGDKIRTTKVILQ